MKILIIGGTSSIGIYLKEALSSEHEIITCGREGCDIYLDLSENNKEFWFPEGIECVIHTAAYFDQGRPEDAYNATLINVLGTIKIIEATIKTKCKKLIYISSIYSELKKESPFYSPYSITKKQSEEICEYLCKNNSISLTILKPSQIFGNFNTFKKRHPFLNLIIEQAKKGNDIFLYGNRDAKINIIHIKDLIKVIKSVLEKGIIGTYPCQYQKNISYFEFAKIVYKHLGKGGKMCFDEGKPNIEDRIFDFDNSIYEKIGYYPEISMEEGIIELLGEKNKEK